MLSVFPYFNFAKFLGVFSGGFQKNHIFYYIFQIFFFELFRKKMIMLMVQVVDKKRFKEIDRRLSRDL